MTLPRAPPELDIRDDAGFADYARNVVDQLDYWVRDQGIRNLKYYCMSNELSLNGWGKMAQNMNLFRRYHRALYEELARRGLDIKLLASDASPIEWWWTVEWAANNMDDITGVYGGHHYINDRPLTDEWFYGWFLEKWGAGIARAKGKRFILGEFGAKQDGSQVRGKHNDACIYNDTPFERFVPIQLAEAAIAAINGGVHAMGYWTFMGCPDNWNSSYRNKWGLFKCDDGDFQTRDYYYGYGLLSKFLRGPATVYSLETNDTRIRAAAIRNNRSGAWTIAVVNRNCQGVPLQMDAAGAAATGSFRKYVYAPLNVPQNEFGDLQEPVDVVPMADGKLIDSLPGGTLTVYTTAYDDTPPAQVTRVAAARLEGGNEVTWEPVGDADLCYYRVYRASRQPVPTAPQYQVVSTIATRFMDKTGWPGAQSAVVAVDRSGNPGPPGRS